MDNRRYELSWHRLARPDTQDWKQVHQPHNNFLDMIDEYHLSQVIKDPTRGENTLDLFLTNSDTFVTNNQTLPGISEHSAILVESRIRSDKVQQSPRRIPMRNKMKAEDTEAFREHTREGWDSLSEETKAGSADSLWKWFTARLEEEIKQYVPNRNVGKKTTAHGSPENWNDFSKKEKKTPCQSEALSLQHKHLKTEGHTA